MALDIGAELRAAREAKGLSLGTLAQRIRVQPRTLAAIELNDLSLLPPRPFGRGFVKAYAEEVDLDPEHTVQNFFAQFPARPVPGTSTARREIAETLLNPPSNWVGLGAAATILMLVVAAAVVVGRRNEAPPVGNVVGTTGSTGSAAAPTPAAATTAAPAEPANNVPSVPAAPLRFAFVVSRPCWVTAVTDGQRALYRIVYPGDPQVLNAQREITIRFGDAGAVTWSINGRGGTPLGDNGAIRDVRITRENAATLR
jgi:cytoskeleton protein RodZ